MRYTLYIVVLAAAMLAHGARAQEVRGRVTDAEGRAVEPATVAVFRGDRQLAADVTDTAGRFRLSAPDGPYTLRVRHVAYRPLDTLIAAHGRSGDELSLVMTEVSVGLGEVTVQAERIVREADRFVVHVGDAPAMAGRDGAELLRTAPGVWVIGDVTSGPMLAHKAEEEAIVCIERIAGHAAEMNAEVIPSVIYTQPEVASVGFGEEQLQAARREYKVGRFPFSANSRAKINHESEGFIKILSDARSDQVLGVHMVGPGVSEMIGEACVAMEFSASARALS